jgi:hypothetical protein
VRKLLGDTPSLWVGSFIREKNRKKNSWKNFKIFKQKFIIFFLENIQYNFLTILAKFIEELRQKIDDSGKKGKINIYKLKKINENKNIKFLDIFFI